MKFWHSLPCVLPKFHFGTPMQVPANCLCQPVKPAGEQIPAGLSSTR
ncbi:MAG: hypothetical protein GY795_30420 [Desulfobacterales bacterium]|nr:hypothetical protein [Desulfobacterales bacterium]